MLYTWSKIEKPPKPSKNAAKIILIEICLHGIEVICIIPFVSSKTPHTELIANWKSSMPSILNKGNKQKPLIKVEEMPNHEYNSEESN